MVNLASLRCNPDVRSQSEQPLRAMGRHESARCSARTRTTTAMQITHRRRTAASSLPSHAMPSYHRASLRTLPSHLSSCAIPAHRASHPRLVQSAHSCGLVEAFHLVSFQVERRSPARCPSRRTACAGAASSRRCTRRAARSSGSRRSTARSLRGAVMP